MTTFNDRENAFENKYAHDAETRFKIEARANKLLGSWVATEILGKSGDEVTAYAIEVVKADFEEPGIEDVVRKISGDVAGKISDDDIRNKHAEMLIEAQKQIEAGN